MNSKILINKYAESIQSSCEAEIDDVHFKLTARFNSMLHAIHNAYYMSIIEAISQ